MYQQLGNKYAVAVYIHIVDSLHLVTVCAPSPTYALLKGLKEVLDLRNIIFDSDPYAILSSLIDDSGEGIKNALEDLDLTVEVLQIS